MSIEAHGAYRDGAIHTDQPLPLSENTPVRVIVVPQPAGVLPVPFPSVYEEVLAIRPKSPRFTGEELRARLAKHSFAVGSLPEDFSRADIYSDHD